MLPILNFLSQERLLMDGAMGTYLRHKGLPPDTPSDLWNLEQPETVESVHREYQQAGAQLLLTNTFGSSRNRLKIHGLDQQVAEINARAVELCRRASASRTYVGGCVGPIGSLEIPFEQLPFFEAADIYQEQIFHLLEAGIDILVLETLFSAKEIKTAAIVAQDLCKGKIPILLSMSLNAQGKLRAGENPIDLLPYLEEAHVNIIGLNCSFGPEALLNAVSKLRSETKFPIAAKPNAGLPEVTGYPILPEAFADWGMRFFREGVGLFGGCCGTTPEHIRKLAEIKTASG